MLESKLAADVRTYLRVRSSGDDAKEPDALRWVCCDLEWLLGAGLQDEGYKGWVDGILPATDMLPDAVELISEIELIVRGTADWVDGTGSYWIEPFFGRVQVSAETDSIVSYELRFGNAARGLGTTPYGKHVRYVDWFTPTQWLFTISKMANAV